jgi:hypothetical protein
MHNFMLSPPVRDPTLRASFSAVQRSMKTNAAIDTRVTQGKPDEAKTSVNGEQ